MPKALKIVGRFRKRDMVGLRGSGKWGEGGVVERQKPAVAGCEGSDIDWCFLVAGARIGHCFRGLSEAHIER
jgi:hypothetical protein